jgi:hypothetical protein
MPLLTSKEVQIKGFAALVYIISSYQRQNFLLGESILLRIKPKHHLQQQIFTHQIFIRFLKLLMLITLT